MFLAEKKELDSFRLATAVRTKIFNEKGAVKARECGVCTMTKDAFAYHSGQTDFCIEMENLIALPFSCGEEFELYYKNELYYFYPDKNREQCARWALITDLLKEERDNKGKETCNV